MDWCDKLQEKLESEHQIDGDIRRKCVSSDLLSLSLLISPSIPSVNHTAFYQLFHREGARIRHDDDGYDGGDDGADELDSMARLFPNFPCFFWYYLADKRRRRFR